MYMVAHKLLVINNFFDCEGGIYKLPLLHLTCILILMSCFTVKVMVLNFYRAFIDSYSLR